jgi:ribonuclease VapC
MSDLVVDTSAAVAILDAEPERQALVAALERADLKLMSPVSLVELGMVLEGRRGTATQGAADRFVRDAGIDVVAVDESHADGAIAGWRRFGRGRHRARLNLGDCFTYALAVASDLPILCVGTGFAQTDVDVVDLRPGP